MNITVYLGALKGNDESLEKAVRELGTFIGKSGNTLIYGGSKSGLMGLIAESTLNSGGKAIGVEPQFFIDKELQYDGLTQLIITDDMSERKKDENDRTWRCFYRISRRHGNIGGNKRGYVKSITKTA